MKHIYTLRGQNTEIWALKCVVRTVTTNYVEYSRTRQADSLSDY